MKILQLIHKKQSRGAEIFASQLSNHLLDEGHKVKMICLYEGTANLPFRGEIHSLGASSKSSFLDRPAWKRLDKLIRLFEPDVVQANSGDTLKYAALSKVMYGWNYPLIFRNASEVGRYLNSSAQKFIYSYFYKNVSKVISVSRASELDLLKNFPFLQGKTKVIGVGLEEIKIENKLLMPIKKKNIVHVGGFSFEKNHFGILRIFEKVLLKNPNTHLHFVGNGNLKLEVEAAVTEMKLSEHISFHGHVNNPLDYINSADVLILPSIIEGLPGVLLEAMYCKTPVVAYNVGGISEIVDEDTGSLIPKNNESYFTEEILKILNNVPEKKIEAGHKMVKRNFMNKNIAKDFISSYQQLLVPIAF